MKDTIQLSAKFSLHASQYAILKTAILGLPDSGKSYTAMKIAEQLLDIGIPIVALDPIGIWHGLKIGVGKHKGYKIVVAGGEYADIPLTKESAPEIMRAAMVENVPVIFDLYSTDMANKSTWINVLTSILHVLIYENKPYGQRHVFIEEAGEFAPQQKQPQHYQVYNYIERLTRIGRNMNLGATFINQRAEDLSKSILENCNITILHNQEGRNSLKNIENWLRSKRIKDIEPIMKSLPVLNQGECWVLQRKHEPIKIKVSPRNTFHPNPENPIEITRNKITDVAIFLKKLNAILVKEKPEQKSKPGLKGKDTKISPAKGPDEELVRLKDLLKEAISQRDAAHNTHKKVIQRYRKTIEVLTYEFSQVMEHMTKIANDIEQDNKQLLLRETNDKKPDPFLGKPSSIRLHTPSSAPIPPKGPAVLNGNDSGQARMLKAAATFYPRPITKQRMGLIVGIKPGGSTFGEYFRRLKRAGKLMGDGNNITITDDGLADVGDNYEPLPDNPAALIQMWCDKIGGGMAKMLLSLTDVYPRGLSKEELGERVGISSSGSTFGEYFRRLKRLDLIIFRDGEAYAVKELFPEQ